MVTDKYYEEELLYQSVIDAKKRADQLPEKPIYNQSTQGIKLTLPKDVNNSNSMVSFCVE
ncbi:hypothetical protein [Chryseobacterium indoltheticum]|uniref:hypothetical protein n=1 Tax=Chryseobacterium indoltheticum TaxID=254 RepID=UPI003F496CF9